MEDIDHAPFMAGLFIFDGTQGWGLLSIEWSDKWVVKPERIWDDEGEGKYFSSLHPHPKTLFNDSYGCFCFNLLPG
jgi:hypothetical protein